MVTRFDLASKLIFMFQKVPVGTEEELTDSDHLKVPQPDEVTENHHTTECRNSACLDEKHKNQQEIAKLARHLRFLIDDVREKNEIIGSQHRQ